MKRRTGVWRGKRIVTDDPSELREDEICLQEAYGEDGLCFSLNLVARQKGRDVEVDDKGQRVYAKVKRWSGDYGVLGTLYRKCPLANHSGKVVAKTMRGMRDDFMDGSYPKE